MCNFFTYFDWTNLQNLGTLGFLGFIFHDVWHLFFLFYLIQFVNIYRKAAQAENELNDGQSLNRYFETFFLSQLNPYTVVRSMMQMTGQLIVWLRNFQGLPNPESYTQFVAYLPPFEGEWLVYNGGTSRENSHSWDILTQRYAYDFVKVDEQGHTHQGAGNQLQDYYCWQANVLAPAAGIVVQVKNTIEDYSGVGDLSIDWKTRDFRGNFIVIRHHPREYSFIAHFHKGSIQVKKGDSVECGQILGKCGNSGHSTEPHIHFHLQDRKNIWLATGLPVQFSEFWVNGKKKEKGFVERGEQLIAGGS